jgi:hypothetical protein
MMQAFNKKLDDLQKDLEKVKRNQAGTHRNTRISDIKKDTECLKCGIYGSTCVKMRLVITPFACVVIISQLYNSVVTFYFLVVLLDILRKCYFSSLWHTTGLHNWGHDIIIISHFGK